MPAAPLRRLSAILLPTLGLLLLAGIFGLLLLPTADSAQAQTAQTVPSDWALIPDGIAPGDSFRLLFVTSTTRDASSTDISDYNAHVQAAAGNNSSLADFNGQFRALISTSAVDAKTNTATTGTGVSVHWLGGEKVADDYADLYDGSWDSVSGKTESGAGYTGLVWTGGNKAGQKSGQRHAGASEVRLGDLSDVTLPLSSPNAGASSETHPLYALSPVITVAEPEPEPTPTPTPQPANNEPQFASGTADRSVNEDAAIGTNVGEAVTATDTDSDALTYAITGSDAFAIDAGNGQIAVAGALDYETTPSYTLTVSVSDGKDAAGEADTSVDDTIAVTVSVGNVDEAGTVSLNAETDPPQVGGALTAQTQDPDGVVSGVTWSWARSADGTNWAAIDGATQAAYTPLVDDVGYYLQATAAYTDPQGPGKTASGSTASAVTAASATLETEPAITAGPVITSSPASGDTYGKGETIEVSITFSEAVTVTGEPRVRLEMGERKRFARYSAIDGAIVTFAYTIRGNDRDEDGLSIEANRLQLNGGTIQDADGNDARLEHPALTDQSGHQVDGSRQGGGQSSPPPANSPPTFPAATATRSVNEDAAVGSNVGDPVAATDADQDTLTYTVTGSDAFAIDASTGQITVARALDETAVAYLLRVSVSDGKNADGEADASVDATIPVTVNVVKADQPGQVIVGAAPQAGKAVTAVVQDPDGDASDVFWSWARSVDQAAWENIDGANGSSYTPSEDDVGFYLRATAFYTDPHGPGKTASETTLYPVAPWVVQPQTPSTTNIVWTATLTVDQDGDLGLTFGCDNTEALQDNCSTTSVLSEDEFAHGGTTYAVVGAYWASNRDDFRLVLADATSRNTPLGGATIKSALSSLALSVDGTGLAVKDARAHTDMIGWAFEPSTDWVDGQKVSLQLVSTPSMPRLTATAGDEQATLTWTDPKDTSIIKYQYRDYDGYRRDNEWKDIPGSGATTNSYTVTGLPNWHRYSFEIRAVNVLGDGPESNRARVHPRPDAAAAPAKPTGLSATAGDGRATLIWTDPGDPTITKYERQTKVGSAAWGSWAAVSGGYTAISHTATGLNNGTAYSFRIRAVNVAGYGPASNAVSVTPRAGIDNPPTYSMANFPGGFSREEFGSGQKESRQGSNRRLWKAGNTNVEATLIFSEAIDTNETIIKGRVGSGPETTFTFVSQARSAGQCSTAPGVTNGIVCKYRPSRTDEGVFKVRVAAVKDTAGTAGAPGGYNITGLYIVPAPAAPVLTLKHPSGSPSGVTQPTFTATLSQGRGVVWLDTQSNCSSRYNNGPNVQAEVAVHDETPPYTVDIKVKSSKAITENGPITYYVMHTDGDFPAESPCAAGFTYVYDRSLPELSVATSGPYYEDDLVVVNATFNNIPSDQTLQLRGFPSIDLNVGGKVRWAYATKVVGGNTIPFKYRVHDYDYDPDGVSVQPQDIDFSRAYRTENDIYFASGGNKVQALERVGGMSSPGASQAVDGLRKVAGAGPAAPQNLRAIAGDGMVQLLWDELYDSHVDGWLIWQKGVTGWKRIATVGDEHRYKPNTQGYKVTGLTNGRTYEFRVRATYTDYRNRPNAGAGDVAGPVNATPQAGLANPNRAPQWKEGWTTRGDRNPYQYLNTYGSERDPQERSGVAIARAAFYDPDSDPLTYRILSSGGTTSGGASAFSMDGRGRIVSNAQTRDFLNRNYTFTLCVEARDPAGATATHCLVIEGNRDWPDG